MIIYGIYMTFLKTRSGDFVGTPPQVRYKHGGGDYQSLRFPTYGHPEFKFYDDLFYPAHDRRSGCSRKKRVAKNIGELLTARALAYWFQDDGSYRTRNAKRYYVLNTQSFLFEDQQTLVQSLKDNF